MTAPQDAIVATVVAAVIAALAASLCGLLIGPYRVSALNGRGW